MSTVDQYLEAICPNLYNADFKSIYVELATESTSEDYFGTKYNYAIALRAAHNYTIDSSRTDGTGGAITGKTEGRVSIQYWNSIPNSDHSGLNQTTYGQKLKALMRSIGAPISIGVVGVL